MKKLIWLFFLPVLLSCDKNQHGSYQILFVEKEEGVEPYQTRMIITENFVRVDDGKDSKDYVLFNRRKKIVYSVNSDEKTVMAVHDKKITITPPIKLVHSVENMQALKSAPEIEGLKARHYQLKTNNEICYDVVAVENLMPEVVNALIEFHSHMAADSAVTFNNIPADLHDACEMSMHTFAATRHLQMGFPIKEWGKGNYLRSLMDYQADYKVDEKLFKLPENYQLYSVQELREGKVKFKE